MLLHLVRSDRPGRRQHPVAAGRRRRRGRRRVRHAHVRGQALQALPEQPRPGHLRQDRRAATRPSASTAAPRSSCPLIQDYAYLNLEPIQIEIPLKGALSIENIRVNVPSVFTVAIGTDPETMQNAAIRLLGLDTEEIKQQAGDIIFGQLRQVIASMRIEDINRDRDKFLESIQKSLEPELKKIGLVLINVNITDITDESGYIEAIGRKAAAQAIQQAKIDVAEQEKQGQIGVAEAERERVDPGGQRHQAARDRHPRGDPRAGRPRGPAREGTEGRRADGAARAGGADQGGAAAAGDPDRRARPRPEGRRADRRRSSARRRSRRPTARSGSGWPTPTPRRSAARRRPRPTIAAAQAELAVKKAEAYQLGETKKREAEAAVLEAQNRAMAKAALAEAEKIEAEKRADPRSPGQGREGEDDRRRRGRGREAPASRPRPRRRRSSPSSRPRPAASTRSWPRRARA